MSGARYFSKLDTSQEYWHIKVDEGSSKLLTFATPFGGYRFKRLPFGIHSASEIEGTANSQDDIIVWETLDLNTTIGYNKFSRAYLKSRIEIK